MPDRPGWLSAERRLLRSLQFTVIGGYVADCFVDVSRLPAWGGNSRARSMRVTPGGKALNQAVALARLGCRVAAVGVVGDDQHGHEILATLTGEGVDVNGMELRENVSTPICLCFVGDEGETSFVWHINDSAAVTLDTVKAAYRTIGSSVALLITFEMPTPVVREAIWIANRSGVRVIVQPAPPLPGPGDSASLPWELADIIIPNQIEARALLGSYPGMSEIPAEDLAQALADRLGLRKVVVTLAELGCVTHSAGVSRRYAVHRTAATDTSGASDAFTATLAAHLMAGISESHAIKAAQSSAEWAICHRGGWESMPCVDPTGRLVSCAQRTVAGSQGEKDRDQ